MRKAHTLLGGGKKRFKRPEPKALANNNHLRPSQKHKHNHMKPGVKLKKFKPLGVSGGPKPKFKPPSLLGTKPRALLASPDDENASSSSGATPQVGGLALS